MAMPLATRCLAFFRATSSGYGVKAQSFLVWLSVASWEPINVVKAKTHRRSMAMVERPSKPSPHHHRSRKRKYPPNSPTEVLAVGKSQSPNTLYPWIGRQRPNSHDNRLQVSLRVSPVSQRQQCKQAMGAPNSRRHSPNCTYQKCSHRKFMSFEPTHDSQLFNPAQD